MGGTGNFDQHGGTVCRLIFGKCGGRSFKVAQCYLKLIFFKRSPPGSREDSRYVITSARSGVFGRNVSLMI